MVDSGLRELDLSDNEYKLKQNLVRNAYTLFDSSGEEVMSSKQKLMKMKEEFPFKDSKGNNVFTVKAENVMDIAGDYSLEDSSTGEKIAVLKKDFSFLIHSWKIEDSSGNQIALIQSRGKLVGLLRTFSDVADFLPHRYTIENSRGENIGEMKGKFSLKDTYKISLNDGLENKEAILAAAVTIDALEGN